MNTALVGGGFGLVLGPKAADLGAVFYRAQLENVGRGRALARCSPARNWAAARACARCGRS